MGVIHRGKIKNELEEKIAAWSAKAVEYAKAFGEDFDYSAESIAGLEQILQYYHEDISQSHPTGKQLWSMSCIWGGIFRGCTA